MEKSFIAVYRCAAGREVYLWAFWAEPASHVHELCITSHRDQGGAAWKISVTKPVSKAGLLMEQSLDKKSLRVCDTT